MLARTEIRTFITVLVLTAISGCQGGLGSYLPSFGSKSDAVMNRMQRRHADDKSSVPTPQVTERNFAQVQLALGDSLAKEGNFKAAQAAYEAAIRNDDTLARAYHRLALIHEKTGQSSNARELFLQA